MADRVTFKINGVQRTVEVGDKERLLYVLRERLDLTGTKCGCDDASCGACTVVIDGKAKKSCSVLAKNLDGKEVLTIEGLAEGRELHPIQRAMIEAGAVQCGFCTPGIVMGLYALYKEKPDAGKEEIMDALSGHLCRCTGYEAILEAALTAQKLLKKK